VEVGGSWRVEEEEVNNKSRRKDWEAEKRRLSKGDLTWSSC